MTTPDEGGVVVTIVGSGSLLPSAARGSASHHIETPGRRILLDCGSGALHGLARRGIDWRAIDVVALTHRHIDHVGDLAPLLAAYRYDGRTRPLTLVGPEDVRAFLARLARAHGRWVLDGGYPLDVVPMGGGDVHRVGDVRIRAFSTAHTEQSIAFRVEHPQATVAYTGDTGPTHGLGGWLLGSEVVITECALPDPPNMDTHLSPLGVAKLLAECTPSVALLTHVYPPHDPESFRETVIDSLRAMGADGTRVIAAHDGTICRARAGSATVDRPSGGR